MLTNSWQAWLASDLQNTPCAFIVSQHVEGYDYTSHFKEPTANVNIQQTTFIFPLWRELYRCAVDWHAAAQVGRHQCCVGSLGWM